VVSVSDYGQWGRGYDSRYFHYFKNGLGLERGPPNLVRTLADLIKKVDINRLDGVYC
jgi:hypothetical protein